MADEQTPEQAKRTVNVEVHDGKAGTPIWYRVIDRLGVPVAGLCFAAYCLIQIGTWLAPKIDSLIVGHLGFMHQTAENGKRVAEAQAEMVGAIQEIKKVGQEQAESTRQSVEMHREVLNELKKKPLGSPMSRIDEQLLPFVIFR